MKIPTPIASRFAKLVVAIAAMTSVGILIAVISSDQVLFYLSAGIAIAGAVKIADYYRVIRRKDYECLEGTLISAQVNPVRRRQKITIMQQDNTQVQRTIEGRIHLKEGRSYRLFLKEKHAVSLENLPDSLQPAQVVLGYEAYDILPGKQI